MQREGYSLFPQPLIFTYSQAPEPVSADFSANAHTSLIIGYFGVDMPDTADSVPSSTPRITSVLSGPRDTSDFMLNMHPLVKTLEARLFDERKSATSSARRTGTKLNKAEKRVRAGTEGGGTEDPELIELQDEHTMAIGRKMCIEDARDAIKDMKRQETWGHESTWPAKAISKIVPAFKFKGTAFLAVSCMVPQHVQLVQSMDMDYIALCTDPSHAWTATHAGVTSTVVVSAAVKNTMDKWPAAYASGADTCLKPVKDLCDPELMESMETVDLHLHLPDTSTVRVHGEPENAEPGEPAAADAEAEAEGPAPVTEPAATMRPCLAQLYALPVEDLRSFVMARHNYLGVSESDTKDCIFAKLQSKGGDGLEPGPYVDDHTISRPRDKVLEGDWWTLAQISRSRRGSQRIKGAVRIDKIFEQHPWLGFTPSRRSGCLTLALAMGWVYFLHKKLGLDYAFDDERSVVHRDYEVHYKRFMDGTYDPVWPLPTPRQVAGLEPLDTSTPANWPNPRRVQN